MNLNDLDRPTLHYRVKWWALVAVTASSVCTAGWLAHLNYTLIEANLDLVRLLDTHLSATEARMSRLEEIQRQSIEWLTSGDPRALVEVLERRADE